MRAMPEASDNNMANRFFAGDEYTLEGYVDRRIAAACCVIPGIVEEWDAAKQLAKVKPAVKRKWLNKDTGKPEYDCMPVLCKVPVVVPYSQQAGLLLTVPIRKGDEGLLLFADRSIDMFIKNGGEQNPEECCGADKQYTDPRAHSLSDAVFIPGIISQPNIVEDWQEDAIEIRNKDRTAYFRLDEQGNLTFKTTGALNFETAGDMTFKGANIRLN